MFPLVIIHYDGSKVASSSSFLLMNPTTSHHRALSAEWAAGSCSLRRARYDGRLSGAIRHLPWCRTSADTTTCSVVVESIFQYFFLFVHRIEPSTARRHNPSCFNHVFSPARNRSASVFHTRFSVNSRITSNREQHVMSANTSRPAVLPPSPLLLSAARRRRRRAKNTRFVCTDDGQTSPGYVCTPYENRGRSRVVSSAARPVRSEVKFYTIFI